MDLSQLPPDEDRGIMTLTVHAVLTFIALWVVALRSVAGMTAPDGLKADDYSMQLGMLITTVDLGFTIAGTKFGQGRHILRLEPENGVNAVMTMFVVQFLLPLALAVVKLSVTLFLLRIVGLRKWFRWALIANVAVLLASTLVYIIVLWAQCRPLAANWDPRIMHGVCYKPNVLVNATFVTTACTIVTDFLCALIPLPIIWNLHMDRKTKASITGLMGLGVFAGVCAIVRMTYVSSLHNAREDPTWRLIPLGIWTIVELHVAIIVGSIPPCRALLLRLWSRLRSFSVPSQSSSLDNSLGKPASLRSKISMPFARKFRAPRGLDNHHAHTAGFWQLQPMDGGRNRSVPARVDSSRAAEGKTGRIVKTSNFTITTTTADERDQLEERPDTNYQWK